MKKPGYILLGVLATVVTMGVAALIYVANTGLTARSSPGGLETYIARAVRSLAVQRDVRDLRNPIPPSDAILKNGREHFADHCAVCHANDGSGDTEMGRGLWPKPPDMRLDQTQRLSDGELFYIIEQGARFTGMPGWSTGTPEGEEASWHLVTFIRHLPQITREEVEAMKDGNPQPPAETRQRMEEERFLQGDEPAGAPGPHAH